MYNVHPNKQLRNFSITGLDGKSHITRQEIARLSDTDYAILRARIKKRGQSNGGTSLSSKKQIKKWG